MVLLHANDFLDQTLIERGVFVPCFIEGSIYEAIEETTSIVKMGLKSRLLVIEYNKKQLKRLPKIKFDKRRFQQVLLNLLSNATKYQTQG